jgi:hypothetical protein
MQKVVGSNPISRLPRPLVIAVLVALAAGGCGSGSGETTTRSETRTGTQPTRADFVSLADTICANHRSRREDLESQARELGPITSARQARRIAALLREEAANRRAEVHELEALPTPSLHEMMAASVFPLIRAEAKVIDEWAAAYDDRDRQGIRRLQARLALATATAALQARKYGFDVCGES